jgi:hypothetical protein
MRLLVAIAFLAILLLSYAHAAEIEICDGLDNDKDGVVDNGTCGNGQCDAGETKKECAIDCGSNLSHLAFPDMFKLFQVRSSPSGYEPSGDVAPGTEFTIGFYAYDPLPNYCYVSATTIHNEGYWPWSSIASIDWYRVIALNKDDFDAIFADPKYIKYDGKIREGIIERLDIEKFIAQNPTYSGNTYKFGVETDSNYELKNGVLTTDILPADYQDGKTIVYPVSYDGEGLEQRPYLNFNNEAVREYAAQFVVHEQDRCVSSDIFMDNFLTPDNLFAGNFVSAGTFNEQIEKNTWNLLDILRRARAVNPNPKFILNGYTRTQGSRKKFLEIANRSAENRDTFEMIMFENGFWVDSQSILIKDYYPYVKQLYENGKNSLFVAAGTSDSGTFFSYPDNACKAYKIWLWTHLVGNSRSYLFINTASDKPMISYKTYEYKLGNPLEEPQQNGNTWSRKFERGTIVFDTSAGELDAIKFLEEICDGIDNDLDGSTDEDNVCQTNCNNNQQCEPDLGETFAACPQDCPECINQPMLLGFIGQWKRGEISMLTLMQKMKQWKAGTGCPPA